MKSSTLILALLVAFTSADVSHLANRYLPPNHYHQPTTHRHYPLQTNQNPNGPLMTMPHLPKPSNERVETIIEKHEVVELPTQIEIVKDGQPIYGIQPQNIMAMAGLMDNGISSRYLPPMREIENLQPPQVPYEMPMRTYLPPVPRDIDTKTTELPETTTTMAPTTTTNVPTMEETTTMTTELPTTTTEQEMNNFDSTTTTMASDMSTTEPQTMYDTTTLPAATTTEDVTMPENRYLPPPAFAMEPANRYLPPSPMMLPPYEAMPHTQTQPQSEYQQYDTQLMNDQQMQEQMYRQQEMQEMMQAISQMEQQHMIALDHPQEDLSLQQQPIAPVEPAHVLRPDGYHYKTADDNLRQRYRYRH